MPEEVCENENRAKQLDFIIHHHPTNGYLLIALSYLPMMSV